MIYYAYVMNVHFERLLSLIQFGAYPIGSYSDVWFPFATYYVCTFYIYIYAVAFFRLGSSRLKVPE